MLHALLANMLTAISGKMPVIDVYGVALVIYLAY